MLNTNPYNQAIQNATKSAKEGNLGFRQKRKSRQEIQDEALESVLESLYTALEYSSGHKITEGFLK
jgi:hypothetical protein